jgi:hypothetical protein
MIGGGQELMSTNKKAEEMLVTNLLPPETSLSPPSQALLDFSISHAIPREPPKTGEFNGTPAHEGLELKNNTDMLTIGPPVTAGTKRKVTESGLNDSVSNSANTCPIDPNANPKVLTRPHSLNTPAFLEHARVLGLRLEALDVLIPNFEPSVYCLLL